MTRLGETRQIRMSFRDTAPDEGTDDSRTDLDTDESSDQPRVTRRRAVASVAALGIGGVGLTSLGGDTASAEVTMGDFTATGDSATMSTAPSAVTVSTSGEWSVNAPSGTVEQVMLKLNVAVGDGDDADIASDRVFDAVDGTFELDGELIGDHPDVTADMFSPSGGDAEKTTPVTVAVVVSAVQGGNIIAEARAEDTADVTVSEEGVEVRVGGSATVDVSQDG